MIHLIDTGLILGFFNKRDQYHKWATEQFNIYKAPFYTCEAVITESVFQLLSLGKKPDRLLKYVTTDEFKIKPVFSDRESQKRIQQTIYKYSDLPCDFADACLINMYEQAPKKTKIFTLDSDFHIYRIESGESISTISP